MSQLEPKIKAFKERMQSGELKADKAKIVWFVQTYGWSTVHDMREVMGIRHQTLTSALSHLEDDGVVFKDGQIEQGKDDRLYTIWKYEADPHLQKANANLVLNRKYEAWKKQGLNKFENLMDPGLKRAILEPTMF